MSHLKKFSYPEISGRWIIYSCVFLLFFVLSFTTADSIFEFKQFLPYSSFPSIILILAVSFLFIGNMVGRLIYSTFRFYIIINILISVLFLSSIAFYHFKTSVLGPGFDNFELYQTCKYMAYIIIIAPAFLAGILNAILLKISSGDFVDEKNLLNHYHVAFFSSIASAIFINYYFHFSQLNPVIYSSAICFICFILTVLSIFIRFPYQHETMLAKHYLDEEKTEDTPPVQRDDLLFTYLNFSVIIIYILLGYVTFIKFFNSVYFYNLLYAALMLTSISLGYCIGLIKKQSFWHVYSEMLFPLFCLISISLLFYFEGKCNIKYGLLISSIPGLVFGFSLRSTVYNIYTKYDHQKRFNTLNFSLFILPFPIIIATAFLNFSYMVFFIILYTISLINLLIPGLFLLNLNISYIKKISFFLVSLIFIPAIILFHLYFKIPFNTKLFCTNTQNYDILKDTNFNLPYISEEGEIKLSGTTAFFLSESTIRNHKRAAASALLFIKNDSKGLIIDSNQPFFRNPLFGIMKNSTCLDIIPDSLMDYNRLPESGRQLYIPVKTELLDYFSEHKEQYDYIIEYPNILDQNLHRFKFSDKYYSLINKHLFSTGKYILILDIQYANHNYLNYAFQNLSSSFNHHVVFLFSNILLIIASNDENSLILDAESLDRINSIIKDESLYGLLFFSSAQPLNHFIFDNLSELQLYFASETYYNPMIINIPVSDNIPEKLQEYYLKHDPDINSIIPAEKLGWQLGSSIRSLLAGQKSILQLLKKTDYSESSNDYSDETSHLFELKRYSSYNSQLKTYMDKVLEFKEKYYFNEAFRLEKDKRWDDAATLYNAILTINPNNFDANYHFGLLYITVQDLPNASRYLDAALKLNKNHPQVLYQMGVLMFSSNKINEAISYFEKAREANLNIYQLYMYLGLSFEQLENYEKAKENYEKAILLDPNDAKLKLLLNGIKYKIKQKETSTAIDPKDNMIDDEQGEKMSIPVNKEAVNSRLLDKE